MHSILHRIVIETTPEKLLQAIDTESGLSRWWTQAKQEGTEISFLFGGTNGEHNVVMTVVETDISTTAKREIKWRCTEGPWIETGEFIFLISEHERGACLNFSHHGWQETGDFYQHCNTKWGFFLATSLKQYLETGTGLPHPNDPNI